jgi:hypothetical protein
MNQTLNFRIKSHLERTRMEHIRKELLELVEVGILEEFFFNLVIIHET